MSTSIFSFPFPLKLVVYEEVWEVSWCLPSATPLLPILLLYFFSPRHTFTPPCQSLFPWGQWGRHSRAQATAECASEGKWETDSLSLWHSEHFTVLLCLQHLSFCIKQLIWYHYQVHINLSWGFQSCWSGSCFWQAKTKDTVRFVFPPPGPPA